MYSETVTNLLALCWFYLSDKLSNCT